MITNRTGRALGQKLGDGMGCAIRKADGERRSWGGHIALTRSTATWHIYILVHTLQSAAGYLVQALHHVATYS